MLSFSARNYNFTFKKKSIFLGKCLLLHFVFVILSIIAIHIVDAIIIKLNFPSILELFKKNKINKYGFLMVVIIGPIIEELFFRLPLIANKFNLAFFFFLLSMILLYKGQYPKHMDYHLLLSLTISFTLSLYIYFLLKKNPLIEKSIQYKKDIITIISIIFFGLIHITNIKPLYTELIPVYPIYVLPQISIGYFCSILRIRFGMIWGILFHSTINLIGYCLSLL